MGVPDSWIFPIAVLPGIALLILSAANISNALTDELNQWMDRKDAKAENMARQKIFQLKRLHRAMITLYVGSGCFVLSALVGSHLPVSKDLSNMLATAALCIGIVVILISFIFFINYSIKAVKIKEQYFKHKFSKQIDE